MKLDVTSGVLGWEDGPSSATPLWSSEMVGDRGGHRDVPTEARTVHATVKSLGRLAARPCPSPFSGGTAPVPSVALFPRHLVEEEGDSLLHNDPNKVAANVAPLVQVDDL